MRFENKTVLITGGGSGIGRAAALGFAREGARLFLLGRRTQPLEQVADEIRDGGGEAAAHPADLRKWESVRAAVGGMVQRFGGIDLLVNNAGYVPPWTAVHETPDEVWNEALDINLTGAFRMARAALPHLVERRGAIVNVSSISALQARNSVAAYAAAKAGLLALSRSIAAEYGWQGVRCNCIVPSWVETPMTEEFLQDPATREEVGRRHMLQRVATPDEIARAILYLASEDASFVTGTVHLVDGGMSAL